MTDLTKSTLLAFLLFSSLAVSRSADAQNTAVFGFPQSESGKQTITLTNNGLTLTLSNITDAGSNNGPPHFFRTNQNLLVGSSNDPHDFDIQFDKPVQLVSYKSILDKPASFDLTQGAISSLNNPANMIKGFKFTNTTDTFAANTAINWKSTGGRYAINLFTVNYQDVPVVASPDPSSGQVIGSSGQGSAQLSNFQFQLLSENMRTIVSGLGFGGGFAVVSTSAPEHGGLDPVLASYSPAPVVEVRAQNSPVMRGAWDGWVSGYGVGGNVAGKGGVDGIDYAAGGTQVGLYRLLDADTLFGLWGAYGHQNIDTGAAATSNINSGMLGAFLRRSGYCDDYLLLAFMGAYDNYHSTRVTGTGIARGNFDGGQGGAYLEAGRAYAWCGRTITPTGGLQYTRVQQGDFTETGAGVNNLTVDSAGTDSLSSSIGARIVGYRCTPWGDIEPEIRAHWVHQFLDTSTSTSIATAGGTVQSSGLDMGRDIALLGTGFTFDCGGHASLFANYDLRLNARQNLHAGSSGVRWAW